MEFCFVKTRDTTIKRGDLQEIKHLISEGAVKYVYHNPNYKESDCRTVWDKGLVNVKSVEMKTISRENFWETDHNGKLINKERRSSLSLSTSFRK